MSRHTTDALSAALSACAEEPIHIPDSIQPHGVLLAFDETTMRLAMASDNAATLLGPRAGTPGRTIDELLPAGSQLVREALGADLLEVNPIKLSVSATPVDAVLHRSDGLLVAELEPVDSHAVAPGGAAREDLVVPWYRALPATLQRLQDAATLDDLYAVLAREVRDLTGFDRVMIYRFDPEWNGEVVAEARDFALEPFLGLHYPASDIPAQARALYTVRWLRIIPDINYRPSVLTPRINPLTGAPLDLSGAFLRSVSPVHIEYLRNMRVAASMSVSLIDRGQLWGLIACHHYRGPHRPPQPVRTAAEFLGRTASLLLPTKQNREVYDSMLATGKAQARLTEALAQAPGAPLQALTTGVTTLADLLADAAVVARISGRSWKAGQAPPPPDLERMLTALRPRPGTGPIVTSSLATMHPDLADLAAIASGVLAVPIAGGGRGDVLVWLRPEVLREVAWGGSPEGGTATTGPSGPRLSPRRSFARWSETVRLTAKPWLPHEVEAAVQLGRHVSESLLRRVESDNRLVATLQSTVLLEAMPKLPDITVAVRYLPSQQDVTGGDWYDVVPLPSGRVAFALGDVAGHGLSVTAIGAQLRHGLRAYLLREDGPAAALQSLNELLLSLLPDEMATAVIAEIDPTTGDLHLANAGHPPVLRLGLTEANYPTLSRGPALGARADVSYHDDALFLDPGEGLLLFSDGLVERRGATLDHGLAILSGMVNENPDLDVEALCDRVIASAPSALDGVNSADDLTVLAWRRRGPNVPERPL